MERRLVVAVVSSLVSQALLLLISHPNSSIAAAAAASTPTPHPLFALVLHLLSTSHLAAASLLPRKRKRQESPNPSSPDPAPAPAPEPQCTALALPHPPSSPDHFRLQFGMTSSTFEWLSGSLEPLLDLRDPRPGPPISLPASARLALPLWRLAAGVPYPDLAAQFGVSVSTARFLAKQLCRVLCTNFRFWLSFPDELAPVSSTFRDLSGLPDCCGAVACARFEPFSALIVSDGSSKILSIAAGFRTVSEAGILTRSALYKDVQSGRLLGPSDYLIGDGNYPLLPWLMVPFADPAQGSCEEDFNAAHWRMCRPVRRAVSSLKNWGVLRCLEEEEDVKVAVACVGTCAILHNALLTRDDYSSMSDMTAKEYFVNPEQWKDDAGLKDSVVEKKALDLRSTLAAKARAIHDSGHFARSL